MAEATMDTSTREGAIAKLAALIKGINIAMLTTVDSSDGTLRSRPMGTQQIEFDGELWFFTFDDSPKAREVSREHQVNVSYADLGKQLYVSVSGKGDIVHDRAKMEELYTPYLKAWFPDGLDTPNIALLRVNVDKAEYWEETSRIASYLSMAQAILTGKPNDSGNINEKLDIN